MNDFSKNYSKKQEANSVKIYKGKLQPNSGRGYKKGDWIKLDNSGKTILVVDDKNTIKSSYSINNKVLEKLEGDAISEDALPVLHVEINSDTITSKEFFVIPKWAFKILIDILDDK